MVLVRQRNHRDCAIAALASVAQVPYERVLAAVEPDEWRGNAGLYNRQVVAIAARLGLSLTLTRRYDLASDRGVLRIRWTCGRAALAPGGHFVAVAGGRLFCPSAGEAVPVGEFIARHRPRLCTLLRADQVRF